MEEIRRQKSIMIMSLRKRNTRQFLKDEITREEYQFIELKYLQTFSVRWMLS